MTSAGRPHPHSDLPALATTSRQEWIDEDHLRGRGLAPPRPHRHLRLRQKHHAQFGRDGQKQRDLRPVLLLRLAVPALQDSVNQRSAWDHERGHPTLRRRRPVPPRRRPPPASPPPPATPPIPTGRFSARR